MLKPQQMREVKDDRVLKALFEAIIGSINRFGLQMGIDPKPAGQVDMEEALPAPMAPASITVVSIGGVVLVQLVAGADNLPTTFYFVERSDTETFQQIQESYTLGHGLSLAVPLPSGVTYWRAFCKYQMSLQSPYVVSSSLSGGSGTSGGGVFTDTVASVDDVRSRPPGGFGSDFIAAGEVDETILIPGRRGRDGAPGRSIKGPPGPEAEEPETFGIPGRRGEDGAPGVAGARGRSIPQPEPEEPEFPIIVPGRRGAGGATGLTGAASRVKGPPGPEAEEPDPPLIIPGRRGATGATGATGIGKRGAPGFQPDEPEEVVLIPGRRGKDGLVGKVIRIPAIEPEEPEPPLIIPGRRGVTGAAGGGGGTATIIEPTLTVGVSTRWRGSFVVADASVLPTSEICIWQTHGPYIGKGIRVDEAEMNYLKCFAHPQTGGFAVYWRSVESYVRTDTKPQVFNQFVPVAGANSIITNSEMGPLQVRGKVRGFFRFAYIVYN